MIKFNSEGLFNNGKYGDNIQDLWCPTCKTITTFTEWLDVPGGYLKGIICDNCGDNRQQKSPSYYTCHVYRKKCICGKEHVLLTQDDDYPEYTSDVGVLCECKEIVWFSLPVN